MTAAERCMEILREGPATAADIGLELGMSSRVVCDCLRHWVKMKRVKVRPFTRMLPHEPMQPVNLYELADYGVVE